MAEFAKGRTFMYEEGGEGRRRTNGGAETTTFARNVSKNLEPEAKTFSSDEPPKGYEARPSLYAHSGSLDDGQCAFENRWLHQNIDPSPLAKGNRFRNVKGRNCNFIDFQTLFSSLCPFHCLRSGLCYTPIIGLSVTRLKKEFPAFLKGPFLPSSLSNLLTFFGRRGKKGTLSRPSSLFLPTFPFLSHVSLMNFYAQDVATR